MTRNLNSIFLGGKKLSIFRDETGREGIEFQTMVGVIDILAQGENGDYYVVELKVGKGSDVVTGQIARYMGCVKKNLTAPSNANVKGSIISNEIDEKLKYAPSWIPDITVFKYSINFEILESVLD